jgi:hypothetical protein
MFAMTTRLCNTVVYCAAGPAKETLDFTCFNGQEAWMTFGGQLDYAVPSPEVNTGVIDVPTCRYCDHTRHKSRQPSVVSCNPSVWHHAAGTTKRPAAAGACHAMLL